MNKYNEVMENVKVTEEMHARVLGNVSNSMDEKSSKKHIFSYKKFAPIVAACLLMLFTVFVFPWKNEDPEQSNVTAIPDIVELNTLDELSKNVGFDIKSLNGLSEDIYNITYISFWGDMAEINYKTSEEEITYRISKGDQDNSGLYINYERIEEIKIGSLEVTVKGDGNAYYLAIWTDNSFSYSISSLKGFSVEELEMFIK